MQSMPTTLWGIWFVSEWQARRLGSVPSVDALFAIEVARVKFRSALLGMSSGGTLAAIRAGAPDPVARFAARGEFFSPKIRYASRANGPRVSIRS